MATDPELQFYLHDAMRRLEYNLATLLDAHNQVVFGKGRSRNKVRIFAYSNFLSSVYALQDIVKHYLKAVGLKDHYKLIEDFIKSNEVMYYMRCSRIAQDHTIRPAAAQKVFPIVYFPFDGEHGMVERDPPDLRPLVMDHGTTVVPVPTTSFGVALQEVTMESLAIEAYGLWSVILNGISNGTHELPTGPAKKLERNQGFVGTKH